MQKMYNRSIILKATSYINDAELQINNLESIKSYGTLRRYKLSMSCEVA